MHNSAERGIALLCLSAAAGFALATACSSESDSGGGGTPGGAAGAAGAPGEFCPTEGTGTLRVTVTGLPADAEGRVTVEGFGAPEELTSGGDLDLAGGSYTVTPHIVTTPDPIVRTAYGPSVETGTDPRGRVCLRDGVTSEVTIAYDLIASSGKLFMSNRNGGAGPLLAFAASALGESGDPSADVVADTRGVEGTFDREGNLWVVGTTTTAPPLLRYAARDLGATGEKQAEVELDPAVFGGGLPRATALAFDASGNLWSNVLWAGKLIRFTPAQLRTSGAPEPQVQLEGLEGPAFVAFDAAGNLWTAHEGNVVRFDAARLGASVSDAPDLVVSAQRPPPVSGPLPAAESMAFDADGNAWVNYGGTIARLAATELAGTGTTDVTPETQLTLTVTALPHTIVFDESGGLWFALRQGEFARLSQAQLNAGGAETVTPEILIESPDAATTGWFGLFPAPSGLPLHHSH